MIDERDLINLIEPERYELFEGPTYKFQFERRDFIKAFGLGIVFIVPVARALGQQRGQGESGRGGFNEQLPQEIGAWIHIDEDGGVSVFTGKVEVGQNTRTSLTQAVADELHVPLSTVRLVMGDTDRTPFDAGTFGSRSTPTMAIGPGRAKSSSGERGRKRSGRRARRRATLPKGSGTSPRKPGSRRRRTSKRSESPAISHLPGRTSPSSSLQRWAARRRRPRDMS